MKKGYCSSVSLTLLKFWCGGGLGVEVVAYIYIYITDIAEDLEKWT